LKGDSIHFVKGDRGEEQVGVVAEVGSTPVQDGGLPALLGLERVGDDRFRAGPRRRTAERVFGGAVVAQSALAAGRTVDPQRRLHSLHAYFLRPGDASLPTEYRVAPVRDGASYTTRQVTAEQDGRTTLLLTASFAVPEDGWEHQVPELDVPGPEELPPPEESMAGLDGPVGRWLQTLPRRHPFEFRLAGELPRAAAGRGESAPPAQRFWLRSRTPLPDEPLLHACAATYASDMLLLSTALAPHATMVGAADVAAASLDHAVWFHAPFRADDWLCYDQESSRAAGGRGLCSGRLFDRAGRLVATVAQEGMIRRRNGAGSAVRDLR
jgi:acyl-CoA thioesterase II